MRLNHFVLILPLILYRTTQSLAAGAPSAIPPSVPKQVRALVEENEKRFMSVDCPFLVQSYDPKDTKKTQLAFCIYEESKAQGIFTQSICPGALIEPISLVRNPFYGSHGHWGLVGKCDAEKIKQIMLDPKEVRMTPMKAFKVKREEGMLLRVLRDDFKLWDTFEKLTQAKKP